MVEKKENNGIRTLSSATWRTPGRFNFKPTSPLARRRCLVVQDCASTMPNLSGRSARQDERAQTAYGKQPCFDPAAGSPQESPRSPATARIRNNEGLTTGEDAIAFFASGNVSELTFLYCNRAPCLPHEFKPYDLVVCHEKKCEPEHFTISQAGVVRICPHKPSEHISLADWMHQQMIFQVLTSMLFFKQYLHRKMLNAWKANVRHSMYCQTRQKLAQTAFWAKPAFARRMAAINNVLHVISTTRIFRIETQLYQLQEFVDQQQRQSLIAAKHFDERNDALAKIVDDAVEEVLSSRKPPDTSKVKIRSMAQEKLQLRLLARRLSVAHRDVASLPTYIRMVDMMAHARVVDIVAGESHQVLARLQAKAFSVTVRFGDAMEFAPPLSEFLARFHQLFEQTVACVHNITPLLAMRRFDRAFTEPHTHDATTVENTLKHHQPYQNCLEAIDEKIREDFSRAQAYSDGYFAPYRAIFDFGEKWNENAYVHMAHTQQTLARDMTQMEEFMDYLEKLKTVAVMGSLLLEARTLKGHLAPITDRALSCMKRMLQQYVRERCRLLTLQLEKASKDLDPRPTTLDPFCAFVEMFHNLKVELDSFYEAKSTVEEMVAMLRQYDVRATIEDMTAMDALQASFGGFAEGKKFFDASVFIKESMDAILQQRDKRVDAILEETVALREDMEHDDPTLRKQLDAIKEQVVRVNEYEVVLKQEKTAFTAVQDAEAALAEIEKEYIE